MTRERLRLIRIGREASSRVEIESKSAGSQPADPSGEAGLAAVEFALVAPAFLAIVFGILIYGFFFGTWIAISQAAAEGARASVAGMSTTERTSLAEAAAAAVLVNYGSLLNSKNWTITAQPGAAPHTFQVSVQYDLSGKKFEDVASSISALIPVPTDTPTATVTVGYGGY
ncbi:Flp pilus assembly protein TadG [Inquilinus ginsengisoli]|uniref:TadE/TadG family type IV pilus assembly protein n=1 Tax=Inquilinus ginsengisoli TaxID=363840 RepID=UPI003D198176